MKLTTQSFLSLFDNILNEESKSEVFSELLSKITLNELNNHPVLIQKYKDQILQNQDLTPRTRFLINKTNDLFFLHSCCLNPRFLFKFNTRTFYIDTWKFYYKHLDKIHITSSDVFPEDNIVKLPFDFDKLVVEGNMSIDNIFVDRYEDFNGRWVIAESKKWYESFNFFQISYI